MAYPDAPVDPAVRLTLDGLRDDCKLLLALLDDPHPGLSTWWQILGKRLERLAEYLGEKPAS